MIYQIQYKHKDDRAEFISQNEFDESMPGFIEEMCFWIKDVTRRMPLSGASLLVVPQHHESFTMTKAKIKE